MYAASVAGQPLTFDVAGVWRRNLILRDRQTGTIWQQATGEAVDGPLAGAQLALLGGEEARWASWRAAHPGTAVATEPADAPQPIIPRELIERALQAIPTRFNGPGFHPDNRLPSHTVVAGLAVRGEARAYPLRLLQKQEIVNDEVGGVAIVVWYDAVGDVVRAGKRPSAIPITDRDTLRTLPSLPIQRQWWLGWSEFHPATSIYPVRKSQRSPQQ